MYADSDIWIAGMQEHSVNCPEFHSKRFKGKCDQILQDFYGITDQLQITVENFEQVYTFVSQNY